MTKNIVGVLTHLPTIVNVNGTIKMKSLVFRGPKNFVFAMASRRAASSGNRLLIATFSTYHPHCHHHGANRWRMGGFSYSISSDTVIASVTIFVIFDVQF